MAGSHQPKRSNNKSMERIFLSVGDAFIIGMQQLKGVSIYNLLQSNL